ncbi:MAG: SDR family NAD(P)-dependent oxidoreductase, partial [Desulfosudaceae bacterium]
MSNFSLEGRVALITGASRGIGEAIALILARNGASLVLISRKIEPLQDVVDKVKQAGGSAEAVACNVGRMEQLEELFAHIKKTYGKLDIVVNNAATNPYFGDLLGAEEWAWDKTNDVNLKGPFFITQYAA